MATVSKLKNIIARLTPRFVFSAYYFLWAFLAAVFYRFPSRRMLVIGITGTNGKTSTANMLHAVLQGNGIRSGVLTTASFKIGNAETINKTKNTTLGRFYLQKKLRQMSDAHCRVAIVEVSSWALVTHRLFGVDFDYAVFTNLTPEHIEQHGGFDKYRAAKQLLFKNISKKPRKKIAGFSHAQLDKKIFVNLDSEYAGDFLQFAADKKIGYTVHKRNHLLCDERVLGESVEMDRAGIRLVVDYLAQQQEVKTQLLGEVQAYNVLAAFAVARQLDILPIDIATTLREYNGTPGRMERFVSKRGFDVIVDYAVDPVALQNIYSTLRTLYKGKIIAVFGSCGGGRDVGKRRPMGQIVSGYADYSILTNEDPYFDDPYVIIADVEKGYADNAKEKDRDYEIIINRDHAIEKALLLASSGDVVVITGKGSEVGMNVAGVVAPFSDREVVAKYLR